jgi:hypothetical protein
VGAGKAFRQEDVVAAERRSAAEDQPVMARRHRADLQSLLARFSTFCIAQGRSFVAAAGRSFKAMYPIRVRPAGVVGGDEVGDNALAPSTERHLQFLERQRNSKLPLSIGRCHRNCTGRTVTRSYGEACTVTVANVLAEISGFPCDTSCR